MPKYDKISPSDIRHGDPGQHSVILPSSQISDGDKSEPAAEGS